MSGVLGIKGNLLGYVALTTNHGLGSPCGAECLASENLIYCCWIQINHLSHSCKTIDHSLKHSSSCTLKEIYLLMFVILPNWSTNHSHLIIFFFDTLKLYKNISDVFFLRYTNLWYGYHIPHVFQRILYFIFK